MSNLSLDQCPDNTFLYRALRKGLSVLYTPRRDENYQQNAKFGKKKKRKRKSRTFPTNQFPISLSFLLSYSKKLRSFISLNKVMRKITQENYKFGKIYKDFCHKSVSNLTLSPSISPASVFLSQSKKIRPFISLSKAIREITNNAKVGKTFNDLFHKSAFNLSNSLFP